MEAIVAWDARKHAAEYRKMQEKVATWVEQETKAGRGPQAMKQAEKSSFVNAKHKEKVALPHAFLELGESWQGVLLGGGRTQLGNGPPRGGGMDLGT